MSFFGAGEEPSALEMALLEDPGADVEVALEGTVYRIEEKAKVTAVYVKDSTVSVSSRKFNESKLMVYIRPDQTKIKIGNKVKIYGEASVFDRARNPGNFDQRTYYVRQGIHVLVWAESVKIISRETDAARQFLAELRSEWRGMLIGQLGEYYGGTMSAVLLGDKSSLDGEMKKLYQKNGIGHLLAISGLHMSFIGMGIYSLLRRTGLGFISAGVAGGAILIAYTVMIGAGVSSLRALIMFLIRVGADMTGRDYDLATSLALAAAALVWQQPLYMTDAGFLLSFGAILGLVLLGPVFAAMFGTACPGTGRKKNKSRRAGNKKCGAAARWLAGGLISSLSVNILLLGPILYFYFEVPLYSVFLNLLVIPIMPVAMGAGIAGSFLTLISPAIGSPVLKIGKAVFWLYDQLCSAAGMLPAGRYVAGKPCAGWLITYYVILGCLCGVFYFLYRRKEKDDPELPSKDRWNILLRLPGCGLMLCAVLMTVACRRGYRNAEGIQAAVLDVGQGDCIHIRGREENYLIDGGSSDVSSAGSCRIEPYLLANAVDTLDYVFVTHGDEDHINGIQELLKGQELGVRIRNLVLPPQEYHDEKLEELIYLAQKNGTRALVMNAGDEIAEEIGHGTEGLVLKCLGPEDGQELKPGNEASLVLDLSYGEFRMLFTGDVESRGEELLCKNGRLEQYDVLKAAHHGSRGSSTEEFLRVTQPAAALISAGVDNRYGHPHEETLERLEAAGCRIYSTQQSGTLTVWTDGEIIRLKGILTSDL